ncbi:hypothetical protein DRH27_04325 [Candidatus Falkowbacteria bacterium]|nr:MAG: hypothetical protein DRH27_04325 [Candidatus Falkowbacteria bacterium]
MGHTKKQAKAVKEVTKDLDKLDDGDKNLADMSATEIEKTISAMSAEGLRLRRERKTVRYQLYRLRTDAEGKGAHESTKAFIAKFEDQETFDGWGNFATTWDVAFNDPYRIVHKTKSEQDEWDEVVRAKFPQIGHDGKITYPDIKVRKKVEAEVEKRKKSTNKK